MHKNFKDKLYQSPECTVTEIILEGILCGSPGGSFEDPTESDFNGPWS